MYKVIGCRYEGSFATCDYLDHARLIADSLNLNLNGTAEIDAESHWSYFWVVDKDDNEV